MEDVRAHFKLDSDRDAAEADVSDRRRSSRQHQLTTASLQPVSGDTQIDHQVLVTNLSMGGVGFRSTQKIRVGQSYRITFNAGPLFLNARILVMNVRPRSEGGFDVGAAFN